MRKNNTKLYSALFMHLNLDNNIQKYKCNNIDSYIVKSCTHIKYALLLHMIVFAVISFVINVKASEKLC